MIKFKIALCLGVTIMMFCFWGCSIDMIEENNAEMYSRADTMYMCVSKSFGKGRSDDIYVALNCIYSDESIREKHGSDFEITADNITCHTSEGESFLFGGLYKGQAEYSFAIHNEIYKVKLHKNFFENWTVTECLFE